MKVLVITRSEEEVERCDYRDAYEIKINGKRVFKARDGEPEDNSLGRDFSDIYNIPDLMKIAYEAGKNGEEFEIEYEETDTIWTNYII